MGTTIAQISGLVTLTTVDTPGQPPLGIWGPTDPRPTNPIAGWDPAHGTFPPGTPRPPLGIWGPGDPRPTNPIAGFDPIHGTFPPGAPKPPLVIWGPGDPRPTLPISGWDPGTGAWPQPKPPADPGKIEWKAAWSPTDGWVTVGIIKPEGPVPTPS